MVTQIYNIRSEIWVTPFPGNLEIWQPIVKISARFCTTSRFRHDYLWNATTHRQSALRTTDIPAQANLIWCTLVHERRKIGRKF